MRCLHPQEKTQLVNGNKHNFTHACGQCNSCRATKSSYWATRNMLEWYTHKSGIFVTLTYSPENLPKTVKSRRPTLRKAHLSAFIKRLRKNTGIKRLRYFGCGEYGEKTLRPHYHANIYGIRPEFAEQIILTAWSKRLMPGEPVPDWVPNEYRNIPSMKNRRPIGVITVDETTKGRVFYTTKYCLKSVTNKKSFQNRYGEHDDREPEFAAMSQKPGIGSDYIKQFGYTLVNRNIGINGYPETASKKAKTIWMELPRVLHHRVDGKKEQLMLDNYMQQKLLEAMGAKPMDSAVKAIDQTIKHHITESINYTELGREKQEEIEEATLRKLERLNEKINRNSKI